jgi:ankyrin repeat protein
MNPQANATRPNRRLPFRWILLTAVLLGLTVLARPYFKKSAPACPTLPKDPEKSLLAAIRQGDHDAVQFLLQAGVGAETRDEIQDTALMQAVLNSDAAMMRLLLQHSADVNARGVYDVTVLLRAVHDPKKVEILLDHGARVDRRAMVLAAMTSGSRDTLELLSRHGGSVNSEVGGYTPLMAAAYSDDLAAAAWLVDHGRRPRQTAPRPRRRPERPLPGTRRRRRLSDAAPERRLARPRRLPETAARAQRRPERPGRPLRPLAPPLRRHHRQRRNGKSSPHPWRRRRRPRLAGRRRSRLGPTPWRHVHHRKSVAASLPPLQQSGRAITRTRNCITCHQHSLVAMTVGLARKRGFTVNEDIATTERAHVKAKLEQKIPTLLIGADLDPTLAAYTLAAFEAEDQPPSKLTDALVHYLVLHQRLDGSWRPEAYRPPEDGSPFLFTALAVRGLKTFAPKGRDLEITDRLTRARRWLREAKPRETVDAVFQLLGLKWSSAPAEEIQRAAESLLRQQRPDGGWAQLPTLPSDAYATGQVLYALHEAGSAAFDPSVPQRGVDFLLKSQLADGTWFVPTRCFPALEFSKSGFPHGRSQFISAAATCWAAMALIQTTPPRDPVTD